jgi:dihydroorotase
MIDPHAHLRDWEQAYKETLEHGLETAYLAGVDAVYEEPNTNPTIISIEEIINRIAEAGEAMDILRRRYKDFQMSYGLFAGVTDNPEQIKEVVQAYDELAEVVGLKMFAGRSVGNLEIIDIEKQKLVYQTLAKLNYKGVLAVHCEKEDCMKPELWDPSNPYTHTLARPPEAEVESVKDQIRFAKEAGFKGILHIVHISVPDALKEIEKAREYVDFKITCALTPHHAMLYDEMMKEVNGLWLKMNPPLRPRWMQEAMLQALFDRRIDWIETDHAPHILDEKLGKAFDKEGKPIYASGIPGLPYYPCFIKFLREKGMSQEQIDAITHDNIVRTFGTKVKNTHRAGKQSKKELVELAKRYEFDAFKNLRD